jgi:formylglycine-generating enzyme required for sulfatase activity
MDFRIPCRLPTEDEWEFAARNGARQTSFPWGNDWKSDAANLTTAKIAAVGTYKGDETVVGGFKDMLGNVMEWTSSPFTLYPRHPKEIPPQFKNDFIIRGSSGNESQDLSKYAQWQITRRRNWPVDYKSGFTGFRLACDP